MVDIWWIHLAVINKSRTIDEGAIGSHRVTAFQIGSDQPTSL